MTTAQEAVNSITAGMTVEQLRVLANTVDAGVGDATLLLYSGGVGAIQPDVRNRFGAGFIAESSEMLFVSEDGGRDGICK